MARPLVVVCLAVLACDGPMADFRAGDVVCEGVACTCDDDAPGEWSGELLPLDGSAAWGTVRLRTGVYGATLTIEAGGLEPGVAHPQQLRGAEDGSPVGCPEAEEGAAVGLSEAGAVWGDVLEHLGPFPVADEGGFVRYEAHWDGAGVCPAEARVVAITGAGAGDLWDPRAPVLCGGFARSGRDPAIAR